MDFEQILNDAKAQKYSGQAGPLLDFIRGLAAEEKLSQIAVAISVYTKKIPGTRTFVTNRLPAIILNNYLIYKVTVTAEQLSSWLESHPGWFAQIRDNAMDEKKLVSTVAQLCANISSEA